MLEKLRGASPTLHPAVRRAVLNARDEASRAGQDEIRTEHVLLGLLSVPGPACAALTAAGLAPGDLRAHIPAVSLDADALSSIGIDLDAIRRATDAAFGPGALDRAAGSRPRRLSFATETKRAVACAAHLASGLGHQQMSSGHLLAGILDQQPNGAATALADAGLDLAALRSDVQRRITPAVS
jgi:Clp amino terminal domain, pathogenicity island component